MPPALATLLTIAGVLFLLRREARVADARTPALWLPVLWLGITGSRFVSQWLNLGAGAGDNYSEGSSIDAVYFSMLIVAAFCVLVRRGVRLGEVVSNNKWLFVLFIYAFVSIAWSDFPFIALKRWIKTLGHPLIALVILTDAEPAAALRTVLRRCAFFLLPMSVLFIKYLPEYGRGFDAWSGEATNNGIGLTKNDLGYVCMVMGICFAWNLLGAKRIAEARARPMEVPLCIAFIGTTIWLLDMANSATSLATMVLGVVTMIAVGWSIVSKRYFGTFLLMVLLIGFALESAFDLYETIVAMLGRNPTLTDRTAVWADVMGMQNRPVFGFGFESFWLGDRLGRLWEKWWWRPIQSHNGYIETYVNLGLVGVALWAGLLLSTFRRISRHLQTDFDFARLRLAFLFAIVVFNYTEATFKGVHFLWTIFHIIAMEYPRRQSPALHRAGTSQ